MLSVSNNNCSCPHPIVLRAHHHVHCYAPPSGGQRQHAGSELQVWRHCCQQTTSKSVGLQDRDVYFMVDSSEDKVWLTDFSTNLAHWQVRKHKELDS